MYIRKLQILVLLFCTSFYAETQTTSSSSKLETITISGYIKDASNGETLIGATVFNSNQGVGAITNNYGFYSLTVSSVDTIGIVFSFIGYGAQAKKIITIENITVNISLEPNSSLLDELVISSKRNDDNIQNAQMSVIDVPMKQINTLPALAGERDIIKVIQLLPGVQSGQEGTTGYYVRGGNLDQNLVQLDEATVYNPSHLFGLFSSFNVNAINNVTLIKGGFPAEYGGRLSSILDITMKEGNKSKFSVAGGIGIITSNLTVEGPIVKDKASFIVSARRSYIDLVVKPFIPDNKNNTTYYFYDVNAKINYELTHRDKLFLSFFKGLDDASYTGASSLNYGINFGNSTATLRWNHLFSDKLFSNTSVIYNDYHNNLSTVQGKYYSQLYSGIKDQNIKTDLQYYANSNQTIKIGVNYSYNTFIPASVSYKIPKTGVISTIAPDSIPKKYSSQIAFYVSDEVKFNSKLSTTLGLRVPVFIRDTLHYLRFEPRATIKYAINENTSIKAAYTEMNQFLHLVQSSTASLPTDIWISSSNIVKPQVSRQIALGLFKNFNNNLLETSAEVYYKRMYNSVLFKEGSQPLIAGNIDDQLTFGNGTSYGFEFFLKKNSGKFTGWASYTLSWTTQQFDSINLGVSFPATYDKRHNISLVSTYDFSDKWTFSADWVFTTGGAYTLPLGKITVFEGGSLYDNFYYDYQGKNNYRYRAYHRLDASAILHCKQKKLFKMPYESDWVFSIYNVYSRRNPYFVYLSVDPLTQQPVAKEVSLLPIIPGVNWTFKF